jgi:hypothetical protein
MRVSRVTVFLLAALISVAGCSSPPPVDRRPLGSVTAPPLRCGLVSSDAIERAVGLSNPYTSGFLSSDHYSTCVISKSSKIEDKASMSIELQNPFASTLQSLELAKAQDRGSDLPSGLAPGYSAAIKDTGGNTVGAKAFAWTQDGTKVLAIQIVKGGPGRDHQADAIEFIRQLRPLLLTSTS